MFETKLGLRENPFLAGHQSQYVYPSQEHQEALAQLCDALQNRDPFVLLTGEGGTGKSTAVYDALGEWGSRAVVALITNPKLTRSELLEEIGLRFSAGSPDPLAGPEATPQLEPLLSAIRGRGESAILLLDDAHLLDGELLEEIGRLSVLEMDGEPLVQVFLVGRPGLEVKLAHPELRDLCQRVGIHHRMSPLSVSDTARYIHHRVAAAGGNARELFPTDTCIEVFRISNGYPREINVVAGQALLNALGEGSPTVTIEHVGAVEREIQFQGTLREQAHAVTPAAASAEPFPEREFDEEPEPLETEILSMAPPPPAERSEPEAVPGPAARAGSLSSVPGTDTDAPLQILPSWFDEVVARRQQMEQAETAAASDPATAPSRAAEHTRDASLLPTAGPSTSAPMFVPLERTPSADATAWVPATQMSSPATDVPMAPPVDSAASPTEAPTFVPLAPAVSSEPETGAATASRLSSAPPAETGGGSNYSPMPLDVLTARLRADFAEVEQQAAVKRTGFGWLVAATIVATVVIAALLLIRFGLWTIRRDDTVPAAATAPRATQATTPAPVPDVQTTKPTQVPVGTGSEVREPASSASGSASQATATDGAPVKSNPSATTATKPPPTAAVKETAVPPSTASTAKPSSPSAAIRAAATAPSRATTTRPAKRPPIVADLFGIAVGTYLGEARAISERTRLTESTRLPSQVVTVIEDTVSMYRVVVGSFSDRTSAERAASDLFNRGLVHEARVIPLARATPPPP